MISSIAQLLAFIAVVGICIKPLGAYIAHVYNDERSGFLAKCQCWENSFCRLCGISVQQEMSWKQYANAVLMVSSLSFVLVYAVQRLQAVLPFNPESLPNISPDSSFNTSVSFVTNTNWQGYGGESTMSYFTQMFALGTQNFLSAAVGMAVLVAFVRGFQRTHARTIGNFYVDVIRGIIYILLPLSAILAVILVSQGTVQTFAPYSHATTLEIDSNGTKEEPNQIIAVGPAASQIAIKQLGTNGGGFFNANSAHPFENPTPVSNFLQVVSILLIPAALCYSFGVLVKDRRQGWAILASMTTILLPLIVATVVFEYSPNMHLLRLEIDQTPGEFQTGGNMEGKETRFGITNSALWAVATTAASNGSVNSMHDSYTPLGGLIPMWLMQLGEVVFGGVGSGLYGMLVFALIAVFIAGLMVGRTPEYLGKKIGAFEMKMASLVILLPCCSVLIGTAVALMADQGKATIFNPGPHGFSEVLYAFSSASNNNGSAFAGLGANTPFYNGLLGLVMLIGRFGVIIPVLAIAGSLAAKNKVPSGPGTLPTHSLLFVVLLVVIVILVGALSFFPALALGPIVEHLLLNASR